MIEMIPKKAGRRVGKINIEPIIVSLVTVKTLKSLRIPPKLIIP